MTQNKPPNIRAATIGEIEEYERRRQGGGGEDPPEGLKDRFQRKINDMTLSIRNKAKGIARREIFALEAEGIPREDTRMQALDHEFNIIARGGVSGAVLACRVLLTRAASP
jgi:hypothetical protein